MASLKKNSLYSAGSGSLKNNVFESCVLRDLFKTLVSESCVLRDLQLYQSCRDQNASFNLRL
jgi:hypothetical protein